MPTKPARPCRQPGCPALTNDPSGYCETHHRAEQRRYDAERGTAAERGYDGRWASYSRRYRRDNPLCVNCLKQGRVVASEHTDHIIPVSGPDDPLFWEPSNHQALCQSCHSVKTATEDGAFGNRRTDAQAMPKP